MQSKSFQKRTGEKRDRHNEAAKRYREKHKEKILQKAREYYAENSELIRAKTAAYYLEKNEKALIAAKKYRIRKSEEIAAAKSIYYQKNKDRIRSAIASWSKRNPEAVAAMARNKRARRRGADGRHTRGDIQRILDGQGGKCANCKSVLIKSGKGKYHADHIMPLSKGGTNWPENIQCLCPDCNVRKGAKHPDDWASENGRLL